MDKASKNRWQVRSAAMIIFVLGFAAGVLALKVYRSFAAGGDHPRDESIFAPLDNTNTDQSILRGVEFGGAEENPFLTGGEKDGQVLDGIVLDL